MLLLSWEYAGVDLGPELPRLQPEARLNNSRNKFYKKHIKRLGSPIAPLIGT
jgi:hypothetical protein